MKSIASLLACSILTTWVVAIAIFSVQNATLVSLKFLGYESIKLPVGVVLAFGSGLGVMGGAFTLPLLNSLNRPSNNSRSDNYDNDYEEEIPKDNPSSGSDWLETGSQDW